RERMETELIRRAREGDRQAIRTLYERHAARVYAVVRRFAADDALAEDWAQEAWIRAIRALPRFRGDARFSTWLHRIAVNTALQGQRRRRSRQGREEPIPASLPAAASSSTDDPKVLLRLRLERALERLPEGMRKVLVLHDVEGYTHEEIGEMLGVATGTSKSQLFKARARMRELLRERAGARSGEESWAT
ncbi:MAG: RNA polymerase sigma factor, partial [Gemmatimonadota bacterium]